MCETRKIMRHLRLNMLIFMALFFVVQIPANAEVLTNSQQQFINFILPKAELINQQINKQRQQMLVLFHDHLQGQQLTDEQRTWLTTLANQYAITTPNFNDKHTWYLLRKRVDIIPASLTLAQAANESAWGSSRFAKQGNNYFGLICHTPGCGIIPKQRAQGQHFEVRRFASALQSIKSYMHTLNTNTHYKSLREMRFDRRKKGLPLNPTTLATGLQYYSVLGQVYIQAIQGLIQRTNLTQYDQEIT